MEAATVDDASEAADLAAEKRAEYERYSPVFWRVAKGARELHEPFLAKCIANPVFTSLAARGGAKLLGIVLASHEVFPPPFGADPQPSWLVDDFFVASPDRWPDVGLQLLRAVERAAGEGGAERLIILAARRDAAKGQMLEGAGYERGASWWVHPVEQSDGDVPDLTSTRAIIGPAPPVYDPGGSTALALELADAADVPLFDRWAAASGAALAIVPARSEHLEVEAALAAAGYEPASDWMVRDLT